MANDCGDDDGLVDDDDSTDDDLATADMLADVIDVETQKRLWVRTIVPVLQLATPDVDADDRIVAAFIRTRVAALERVARILRSDMIDD
jgi:hypothetical protein